MGISGLLPYLEKATRPCDLNEFKGGTVAVDSYCLLHKGAISCAEQLARGEDNRQYVDYCLKYVKMLQRYDIHPIMVFDGRNLPAKAETEQKRRENRKFAKQKAAELSALGKPEEAKTFLKQCIDVTPKMANNLIKECRKLKVDCIVAPYESDAQLAFFNMNGVAECVITEDSDLILFGCDKVLYKLDLKGAGRLVESDKIPEAMKMRPDRYTFDKFRYMCILSGCDYVSSLTGIGLKKAEKFFKLTVETDPAIFLDRIPRYLNMKHLNVTKEYKEKVLIANATFQHQVVFDPFKKKLVHLTDPKICGTDEKYLVNAGELFDNETALQIALGNRNPYKEEKFDSWLPEDSKLHDYSIWSSECKKRISRKRSNNLQMIEMKKFITKNSYNETSNECDETLKKEDEQIEEGLSMYTKKIETKDEKIVKLSVPPEPEVKETSLSPVLRTVNPFLLERRLSKFKKTHTSENTVVRSRFFSSNTNSHSKELIQSESENRSVDPSANQADVSSVLAKTDILDKPEILRSCENFMDDAKKSAIIDLSSDNDDREPEESQSTSIAVNILASSGILCDTASEEVIVECDLFDNFEMNQDQITKKRKCEPETQGVSKKRPVQQSLHSFFPTLKKL